VDILDPMPGEERNTVKAFLPVHLGVIAERSQFQVREPFVDRLDLLQADHIGIGLTQPRKEIVDARLDTVDVPGGDAHQKYRRQPSPLAGVGAPSLCEGAGEG
jgi:hypothetical protein